MIRLKQYLFSETIINRILYCIIFIFFAIQTVDAGYKLAFQRNYDIHHIKIKLELNVEQESLTGEATISLSPLIDNFSTFELHAKDIEIRDITLIEENNLSFLADSETVIITLTEALQKQDTITVKIKYYTEPSAGIHFNKPTEEKPKTPYQIFSHSEPIQARFWFPCYDEPDDKFTSEIIAEVPENFSLLSNGRLLSTVHNRKDKTKTFHWYQNKPHTSYLVSVAAGEYAEIRDKFDKVPLFYYVYKDQVENAQNSFAKTPKMMSFYQNLFDFAYPWDKYAQIVVADYHVGGMENTSATTLNDRTIHDLRAHLDMNSDELVAHELAHQWFGDLVTCKNWSHLWLNEGFATYAEILYKEFDSGPASAQYDVYEDQKFYLEMSDRKFHQPIVFEDYLHPDEMFNVIAYQKAGQVLHMLRYVLGDSIFIQSLQAHLKQYAYQSVETKDFQQVVEKIYGRDLNWFFDQWIYHGGHPKFKISSEFRPEISEILLIVEQTQKDSLSLVPLVFQMPVEIEIIGASNRITQKVFLNSRVDTFKFSFPSSPRLIRFDKDNWILKESSFIKTQQEWIFQLLHDENVAARLIAIEELEGTTYDTLETVLTLEKCILNDPFWAVRKEAAYLFIDYQRPESKTVLIKACRDPHPKVRAAALIALSYFYDKKLDSLFREIAENDSSYYVVAEAIYGLSNVPDDSSFEFFSKFVDMDSHNDVIRTAAFHSLRQLKDTRVLPIAMRYAGDRSQPEYLRITALSILKEIGNGNPEVESFAIELLSDSDDFIKKKAIDILGLFKNERSLQALKELQESSLPDDVRRRLKISIEKIESGLDRN